MKRFICVLFLSSFLFLNVYGQTAISGINAVYEDVTDPSDNYTSGGLGYNFNVGGENNLILESIIVG